LAVKTGVESGELALPAANAERLVEIAVRLVASALGLAELLLGGKTFSWACLKVIVGSPRRW
jgi:hypothetical protein